MEAMLDRMILLGLYAVALLVTFLFTLQRYRFLRRKRNGKSRWGFYPSAAALGNALQQLSVFAQPQVEHVIAEKQAEEVEEDDEGAPPDPVAHLHRQAAKIRRGEKIDRLTAIRRP